MVNKKYCFYIFIQLVVLLENSASFADSSFLEATKQNFHKFVKKKPNSKVFQVSYQQDPEKGVKVKITTPTFILRTFKDKDINFLKSLYQDPSLMKTLMVNGQTFSNEQLDRELKSWQEKKKKSAFTLYVMEDKEKRHPIGVFELFPKKDILEVSYIIGQAFQGRGWGATLMKTVMKDLIPLLKKESALKNKVSLIGYVLQDNFASLKILNKVGFIPKVVEGNGGLPSHWKLFEFPL